MRSFALTTILAPIDLIPDVEILCPRTMPSLTMKWLFSQFRAKFSMAKGHAAVGKGSVRQVNEVFSDHWVDGPLPLDFVCTKFRVIPLDIGDFQAMARLWTATPLLERFSPTHKSLVNYDCNLCHLPKMHIRVEDSFREECHYSGSHSHASIPDIYEVQKVQPRFLPRMKSNPYWSEGGEKSINNCFLNIGATVACQEASVEALSRSGDSEKIPRFPKLKVVLFADILLVYPNDRKHRDLCLPWFQLPPPIGI
ncbi:hypothetical protein Tco_0485565 [Tanacetum coccineum]|uniref:Uncharacterized protein n=1 Tax=Tanacetum coccineum TaxID=301880 RepID=A0ABQ5ET17_9ASTR